MFEVSDTLAIFGIWNHNAGNYSTLPAAKESFQRLAEAFCRVAALSCQGHHRSEQLDSWDETGVDKSIDIYVCYMCMHIHCIWTSISRERESHLSIYLHPYICICISIYILCLSIYLSVSTFCIYLPAPVSTSSISTHRNMAASRVWSGGCCVLDATLLELLAFAGFVVDFLGNLAEPSQRVATETFFQLEVS